MVPKPVSFKSVWNKIKSKNDIETAPTPTKALPKRTPLVASGGSISQLNTGPLIKSKLFMQFPNLVPKTPGEGEKSSGDIDKSVPLTVRVESSRSYDYPLDPGSDECVDVRRSSLETALNSTTIEDTGSIFNEDSIFRALIATDTHLGYKEDDIYRHDDSLNTFEEILYLAKNLNVDCIFHSGDLFDKNIPSRPVMYKTMDLIKNYCTLQGTTNSLIVDDSNIQRLNVSRENVDYSRRIPIFIIHGNHDNPTEHSFLSPIDMLDVVGLVRYEITERLLCSDVCTMVIPRGGKPREESCTRNLHQIHLYSFRLTPITIQKGGLKVALYGLGWVKDERLASLFGEDKVEFVLPDDPDSYYKVLLIHQNRYPRRGNNIKDYINPTMLPDWLDLVIWGHEHECFKLPQESLDHSFQILQLGSSIQTSLVQAEIPLKHCCLLEVTNEDVKFFPITLETSRILHYEELSLDDYDIKSNDELYNILHLHVTKIKEDMAMQKTKLKASTLNKVINGKTFNLSNVTKNVENMPLVRIKVTNNGNLTINPKIFGNSFIGLVANPNDILRFSNNRKALNNKEIIEDPQKNAKHSVMSYIEHNCKLSLLLETELNDRIAQFIDGMESQIINEYVTKKLESVQSYLKGEVHKYVDEQLSDDLYQEILVRTISSKTQKDRGNPPVERVGAAKSIGIKKPTESSTLKSHNIFAKTPIKGGSRQTKRTKSPGTTPKSKKKKNDKTIKKSQSLNEVKKTDCSPKGYQNTIIAMLGLKKT